MACLSLSPPRAVRPPRPVVFQRSKPAVVERRFDFEIALALPHCTYCLGRGRVYNLRRERTCACVWRAVFRSVMDRYYSIIADKSRFTRVDIWRHVEATGIFKPTKYRYGVSYGRKNEEFVADVEFTARRVLSEQKFNGFRIHFLSRWDYRRSSLELGITNSYFFHLIYDIQQRLGREFASMKPYALYPLGEYFAR